MVPSGAAKPSRQGPASRPRPRRDQLTDARRRPAEMIIVDLGAAGGWRGHAGSTSPAQPAVIDDDDLLCPPRPQWFGHTSKNGGCVLAHLKADELRDGGDELLTVPRPELAGWSCGTRDQRSADHSDLPRYAGIATFALLPRLEDVERLTLRSSASLSTQERAFVWRTLGPAHIREHSRQLHPYHAEHDAYPFATCKSPTGATSASALTMCRVRSRSLRLT